MRRTGSFRWLAEASGIEVVVAGMNPAMMVPFATKAAADIWIVEHKKPKKFH
jgi:hypothetical protein